MIAQMDPYIESAYKKLQLISQDKEKRQEYEAREKAIRDHAEMMLEAEERGWKRGIEEGIEEGIEKGIEKGEYRKSIQVAKEMLSKGFDMAVISQISGIPLEEVEILKSSRLPHLT